MHPRDQPESGGERDGDVRRAAPEALGRPRHPARGRPPGRRGPRGRGREHAPASARRPPGEVTGPCAGRHPDDPRTTVPTEGVPDDPRLSPDGSQVAYVIDGALFVQGVDGGRRQELASDPDPDVHWGLADFIAAEELDRRRGFWWSPDGTRIA